MDITIYDVSLVLVLIGVLEVFKRLGVASKWLPVFGLILGCIFGVVYVAPGDPAQGALVGIALALSATGLYSGAKNTVEIMRGE